MRDPVGDGVDGTVGRVTGSSDPVLKDTVRKARGEATKLSQNPPSPCGMFRGTSARSRERPCDTGCRHLLGRFVERSAAATEGARRPARPGAGVSREEDPAHVGARRLDAPSPGRCARSATGGRRSGAARR